MSVDAAIIARLRLIVNEPTNAGNYTDALLTAHIERYPVIDERGELPYFFTSDVPPARDPNDLWIPTYDLYAAAADIWQQKAAAVAADYQFSSDDQSFSRQQVFEQYMAQVRFCRARSMAKTMTQLPKEFDQRPVWIGNLPEPGD